MKRLNKRDWWDLLGLAAIVVNVLAIAHLGGCTIGTTNKVTVNQYSDSDSSKTNISNITIQKDTIKTKTK